jgi:hypothetical protein
MSLQKGPAAGNMLSRERGKTQLRSSPAAHDCMATKDLTEIRLSMAIALHNHGFSLPRACRTSDRDATCAA